MAGEKTDQVAQQAQNFFNKGVAAFERGNFDIAIDLLMQCVTFSPGFSRARKVLRAAQIAKFRKEKKSKMAAQVQEFSAVLLRMKIAGLIKAGKTETALIECEKLLNMNPLHSQNVELAVEAADAAGHPEAALFTVEAAYENNPDDMLLLRRVADYYMRVGDYAKARDAYVKLNAFLPNDQAIFKLLKDAEARVTMASGWEDIAGKKDGYRDLIANKDQAKQLDIQAKAVVAGSDADGLIEEARARIAKEPNNLNFYRALARLLTQNKRFDEAVEALESARKVNAADPELDRAITATKIQAFEAKIAALKTSGDAEGAANMEAEMNQFVFDDLSSRVQRYPNDLKLRFELGLQYYKYDYFDDAIGQLQLAQRSPKERVESLYYLAMCFTKKGQRDMAVMQLETANEQLPIMDELKKKIVFELGNLAEQAGDIEKAFGYYKDVYGADIGYEDIGVRMERIYKLRQSQQG
ncbi:MAG TPA: tetratricopeptide repeat protein [Kiritimatiellia bacterium]|nr:tetratricopeptide repeat protein [Kiritimatiellia bacterium]HPS07282.1 tetratricopeptide repeat protein [Kiritimatiellia bacterium]